MIKAGSRPRTKQAKRTGAADTPNAAKRRKAERRGRWAESLAIVSYLIRFYRPLAIREKTSVGEIDLVVRRGCTLVFAEVKLRADLDSAAESVSQRQQERISRAASHYLSRNPQFADMNARFDVVCVAPWRWPRHVENAFPAAS
jgi:putative endonuclease